MNASSPAPEPEQRIPITSSDPERVKRLDTEAAVDARIFGGNAIPCPLCGAHSHHEKETDHEHA